VTVRVTELGFVVIPVTFALLCTRPRWLMGWTLFLSVFQAAAVVVVQIGGRYPIGLQPVFFAAPIAILAWLLSRRPERWVSAPVARLCAPIYLFALFAVLSAVLFPKAFQGLLVDSPRQGLGAIHLLPLHLTLSNLSIALYLIVCVLFFHVVLEQAAASPDGSAGRRLVGWTLAGVCGAALVGFYQVAAFRLGLAYPHDFFNSNPAYAQLYHSVVAGQARLTGTFTEASMASWFFGAGAVLCLWHVLFGGRRGWYLAGLLASGPALVLTESSTAYLILIGAAALLFLRLVCLERVTARTVGALGTAGVVLLALGAWELRDSHHVHRLLNDLLFRKWRTGSYFQRAYSNRVAFHAFLATHGLGAGLGSLRASSLGATLLGTVGVVGVALAGWFALRLARIEWRVCSLARMRFPDREAVLAALLAMLGAGFVSVTDMLVYLPFWAFTGIYVAALIGETARMGGGCGVAGARAPRFGRVAIADGARAAGQVGLGPQRRAFARQRGWAP
jgi:hypothetical protein